MECRKSCTKPFTACWLGIVLACGLAGLALMQEPEKCPMVDRVARDGVAVADKAIADADRHIGSVERHLAESVKYAHDRRSEMADRLRVESRDEVAKEAKERARQDDTLGRVMTRGVRDLHDADLAAEARIKALEARIKALESRPAPKPVVIEKVVEKVVEKPVLQYVPYVPQYYLTYDRCGNPYYVCH